MGGHFDVRRFFGFASVASFSKVEVDVLAHQTHPVVLFLDKWLLNLKKIIQQKLH
jgi:hypothetical protein